MTHAGAAWLWDGMPMGNGPLLKVRADLSLAFSTDAVREIMRLTPVVTDEDVETLRLLRNECRETMTGFTDEVTPDMQQSWWAAARGNPDWRVFLAKDGDGAVVGFGMVSVRRSYPQNDHRRYVTVGVTEQRRRRGFGTLIFQTLRMLSSGDSVHALIRSDNTASLRAAAKAGYIVLTAPDDPPGIVRMIGRGESW